MTQHRSTPSMTRQIATSIVRLVATVALLTLAAPASASASPSPTEDTSLLTATSTQSFDDAFDRAYALADQTCENFAIVVDEREAQRSGLFSVTISYACSDVPGC